MRVPATDIAEGRLDAEICLQQLSDLLQAVSERRIRVAHSRGWLVLGWIGSLQHLYGLERLLACAVKHSIGALVVHRLEGVAERRGLRTAPRNRKIGEIIHRNGRYLALESSRHLCA